MRRFTVLIGVGLACAGLVEATNLPAVAASAESNVQPAWQGSAWWLAKGAGVDAGANSSPDCLVLLHKQIQHFQKDHSGAGQPDTVWPCEQLLPPAPLTEPLKK